MYPNHDELIEFLHLLGYPNYSDGICFGLAAMAVSPVLNGPASMEKANARLQRIKSSLDAYKNMQRSCEADGEACPTLSWFLDYTLTLDEKIDILAYCEGLAFCFNPKEYPEHFPVNTFLEQNFLLTHSIIQSIETEEKGVVMLTEITACCYYTKLNIKAYLDSLDLTLKASENPASFSFKIGSKNHCIFIGYSQEKNMWCYFKTNQENLGYSFTNRIDEIEKFITDEFYEIQAGFGLVLSTEIYCFNADKEKMIKFKNFWEDRLFESDLFKITPEKIGVDALGRPWIYALALKNDIKALSHLIEQGIEVNTIDTNGLTALDIACYKGHKESVSILLNAGADINRLSPCGIPPILMALDEKRYEIVKLLIERNANLMLKDKDGFEVLDYAIDLARTDVVECILTKLNSPEILLDKTVIEFFLNQQKSDSNYLLSSAAEKFFNTVLEKHFLTVENKTSILQLYIILRENEYRKTKSEHNSLVASFFNLPGSNSRAKLNAAKALLSEEKGLETRSALQSGRLKRIAAFFLAPNTHPKHSNIYIKSSALTV